MPALTRQQWDEVRRAYIENSETVKAIAQRFGISKASIQLRAKLEGWPPRGRSIAHVPTDMSLWAATVKVRRSLIHRLYQALDTKLKLMELRMQKNVEGLGKGEDLPAADHERDTRAIGTLIRSLDKVTEIAADLDRTADGRPKSADAAELFAEADRFRRDLAERLSKFIPASG
jgi:hypothetical protein